MKKNVKEVSGENIVYTNYVNIMPKDIPRVKEKEVEKLSSIFSDESKLTNFHLKVRELLQLAKEIERLDRDMTRKEKRQKNTSQKPISRK